MLYRALRFTYVGTAILTVLFCLVTLAFAPLTARAASPNANPTVTITSAGFNPCPAQSNAIEIQAGTALTFTNTTNTAVTVTFTFTLSSRTQTTSVPAGASVPIIPNFATQFTYTAAGFNQTCFVNVSEALPTSTSVPGSLPPTGGGPLSPTGGGSPWILWGAMLTTLAVAGLLCTLAVRRRWLH